jgi:glyoxylase-like metal-dependent hydrolase (beta-lactamase superfamily II)
VVGEQNAERKAVSEYFDYGVTHAPRKDAVWAVRTEDGGALVIGVLQATRTFTSKAPGAKLPLPKDLAVLAGKGEATQKAEVTSLEVVAFAVPPKESDDPVTVVAGERGDVVLTSDAVHFYEELELDRPFGVVADLEAMYGAYDLVKHLGAEPGATVVPGHDPEVMARFPDLGGHTSGLAVRVG